MDIYALLNCSEHHLNVRIDCRLPESVDRLAGCSCFGERTVQERAVELAKSVMMERRVCLARIDHMLNTGTRLNPAIYVAVNELIKQFCEISCPTQPADKTYETWKRECTATTTTLFQQINRTIEEGKEQAYAAIVSGVYPLPQVPAQPTVSPATQNIPLPENSIVCRVGAFDNSEIVILTRVPYQIAGSFLTYFNTETNATHHAPIVNSCSDMIVLPHSRVAVSESTRISIHGKSSLPRSLPSASGITTFCHDPAMSGMSGEDILWSARVGGVLLMEGRDNVPEYNLNLLIRTMTSNAEYLFVGVPGAGIKSLRKGDNTLILDFETGDNTTVSTIVSSLSNPKLFLAGDTDGRLRIWDMRAGKLPQRHLRLAEDHPPTVHRSICDQNRVLSGDENGVVSWDIRQNLTPLWSVDGPQVDFCVRNNQIVRLNPSGSISIIAMPN